MTIFNTPMHRSTVSLDSCPPVASDKTLNVRSVRNTQDSLRRTLDAYGIDSDIDTFSKNREKYTVFIKKDTSGQHISKCGAYISVDGKDKYGGFRWLCDRSLDKYQTKKLIQVTFSNVSLTKLQDGYKNEESTKFLVDLLHGKDSERPDEIYTSTYKNNPSAFCYSAPLDKKGNGFLIYPVLRLVFETAEHYTNGQHKQLKEKREGVHLTAWAVHPALPQGFIKEITGVQQAEGRSQSLGFDLNQKNAECKSGVKSLTSILDLDLNDVKMLEKLETDVTQHLSDVYGISTAKDKTDLFFHFPVALSTATLHLHIWANKGDHPLNESRAFTIGDVIRHLNAGKPINDLVLSRNGGTYILPEKENTHRIAGMPESQTPKPEDAEKLSLPIRNANPAR